MPSWAAVLAVREYRALWLAEAQSIAGDQLMKVAMMIMVYQRTNNAIWAAGVYALTFLPAIAGIGLSQLADRFPRRRLMVTCALIQAGLVGIMAIPNVPLPVVFALVVGVSLAQAPAVAAQNAASREAFTDDALYLRSQDLRGITMNTLMLLGLAGGGLLVTAIGASWSMAINAVTFLISAALIHTRVHSRPAAGSKEDGWFDGAKWVFGDQKLRTLLTLSWLVGFAVVPEGLAAPLAREIGAPDAAIGWLLAADPLGFVVGTFVLSHFVTAQNRLRVLGVLAVGSVAILVAFVLRPNLLFALLLLGAAGAFGSYQIAVSATFNTLVPNEIRGGAFGVARTGLRVAQGVGVAIGGVLTELFDSATTTIALAGLAGTAIAVPAAVMWRRIQGSKASAIADTGL